MPMIIAKRQGHRTAHFFDAEQQVTGDTRKALCGYTCAAEQLEALSELDGTLPCELCIRDAPSDQLPAPEVAEQFPSDDETSAAVYGVALRGEFVWHRVPTPPQLHTYEGRDVVVTECGRIAFLLFGTPPDRYEPCPDCPTEQ